MLSQGSWLWGQHTRLTVGLSWLLTDLMWCLQLLFKILKYLFNSLMSQTYGGRNMKRVGTILQRGTIILFLCCFPCWALFINTETIMLLFRQDPDVARLTQRYVTIFIPALPAVFLYELQTNYLVNQNIIWPQVITGLVVNLLNIILNVVFMYGLKLGVEGSAWANTLSQFAMAGVLFTYIVVKKLHVATWGGWSKDCLQEWGSFLHVAVPSMLMVCIEWWSFEIGGFLAGLVGIVDLGAQAIMMELTAVANMVGLGIGVAASVRIGNALGAGNVEQAKHSCKVALLFIVFCSLIAGSLFAGLKDVIGYIFTSDTEVVALVSHLMLIFAPFHLCDAIAGTCGGILLGSGKQKFGAVTNAVGYYLFGLPIGISLMFAAKLGVIGLWTGMMFTVFMQASIFMVYVLRMDWDKACHEAQVRAGVKAKTEYTKPKVLDLECFSSDINIDENGDLSPNGREQSDSEADVDLNYDSTEQLLKEDSSLEAVNIVGEVLTNKQLILRRGLALFLAVAVLLIGVAVRLLTGNG